MLSFISNGGVILYIIVGLSIIAIALIIERGLFYYSKRERDKELLTRVKEGIINNKLEELYESQSKDTSPEWVMIKRGLEFINSEREKLNHEMEMSAIREMKQLEKNVSYLSNIANIATLLGLLGTVTGMIISFFNMKVSGVSDPAILAGGIAQALITTAAGLSVAIPSLFFYHLFSQIVNNHASKMEMYSSELINFILENRLW